MEEKGQENHDLLRQLWETEGLHEGSDTSVEEDDLLVAQVILQNHNPNTIDIQNTIDEALFYQGADQDSDQENQGDFTDPDSHVYIYDDAYGPPPAWLQ